MVVKRGNARVFVEKRNILGAKIANWVDYDVCMRKDHMEFSGEKPFTIHLWEAAGIRIPGYVFVRAGNRFENLRDKFDSASLPPTVRWHKHRLLSVAMEPTATAKVHQILFVGEDCVVADWFERITFAVLLRNSRANGSLEQLVSRISASVRGLLGGPNHSPNGPSTSAVHSHPSAANAGIAGTIVRTVGMVSPLLGAAATVGFNVYNHLDDR